MPNSGSLSLTCVAHIFGRKVFNLVVESFFYTAKFYFTQSLQTLEEHSLYLAYNERAFAKGLACRKKLESFNIFLVGLTHSSNSVQSTIFFPKLFRIALKNGCCMSLSLLWNKLFRADFVDYKTFLLDHLVFLHHTRRLPKSAISINLVLLSNLSFLHCYSYIFSSRLPTISFYNEKNFCTRKRNQCFCH